MIGTSALDRAAFVLSIDFELIWGTMDLAGPGGFRQQCEVERREVIDRLLDLLVEFEIPATWLIVGHLFLDRCTGGPGKHADIVRPQYPWHPDDWFTHDPDGTEADAPLFLARTLVERIRACPVAQEIGSHSFSHVIFGHPGCPPATAKGEIEAAVRVARDLGIELKSFSYPRNDVGHTALLADHGFTCFRGPEPRWYHDKRTPAMVTRLGHLWDVITMRCPPTVVPRRTDDALIDIPGSMVYFPAHGVRRFLPMYWRVHRAFKGLDAAVASRRAFHLWMHPTNLADEMPRMFEGLRAIFARVADLRDQGRLEVVTMGAMAARMDEARAR